MLDEKIISKNQIFKYLLTVVMWFIQHNTIVKRSHTGFIVLLLKRRNYSNLYLFRIQTCQPKIMNRKWIYWKYIIYEILTQFNIYYIIYWLKHNDQWTIILICFYFIKFKCRVIFLCNFVLQKHHICSKIINKMWSY